MLHPCIQVYVDNCEGCSGKPLFGTSTLTGFNVVVHKDSLVRTFNRGSGLELFLIGIRASGDRREKAQIIIRLNVDSSAIKTFGAAARFINTVVIKPTSVFDAFGKGKPDVLVWDTSHTNRISIIIKAQNTWMRFYVIHSGIGIQGYEGNHVPLAEKPVSRIIIHSTICKKVFKGDGWIELPDFIECKNSQNTVMPVSLSNSQVYRQIVWTIGSSSAKESISIEILFVVTVPPPTSIRIRIAARASAVVYPFAPAVTDFDPMMTCT